MDPSFETEPDARRLRLLEMREATMQRAESLTETFDGIVEAASDVATDDEHDPEGHTIAWERQQTAALLDETRVMLTLVEAALERYDVGDYGICATCGNDIRVERLHVLPATPNCVNCARLSQASGS